MYAKKRLFVFLFVFIFSTMTNLSISADGAPNDFRPSEQPIANTTIEIRTDIGYDDSRGVVGENGYKVFNPGAIKTVTLSSNDRSLRSITRTGSTDAWLAWNWSFDWKKWGWDHFGTHVSTSTAWENDIWVDGYLKVTIDPGWRSTCSNHTSGTYSACSTHFFQLIPRTIYAETNHYFHSNGYSDSYFTTNDSA